MLNGITLTLLVSTLTCVFSFELLIPGSAGRATVDDDDLLEKALRKKLYPLGPRHIDVDNYKKVPGAYKVSITSDAQNSAGNKESLTKALNDLGFTDARVEVATSGDLNWYHGGTRDRFIVYLNYATMIKTMESFIKDTLETTNLKADYDDK